MAIIQVKAKQHRAGSNHGSQRIARDGDAVEHETFQPHEALHGLCSRRHGACARRARVSESLRVVRERARAREMEKNRARARESA